MSQLKYGFISDSHQNPNLVPLAIATLKKLGAEKLILKLGIRKAVSGHFHESSHRANDNQSNHIAEGIFVDELFWNSGYLDGGHCGILIVDDNKVAYKNIRLQ